MISTTMTAGGMTAETMPMRRSSLVQAGRWAAQYSLALIFLWFGALKFTDFEASGIAPLVMNSPLVMWLHGAFGIGGTAHFLGVYEIVTALLLAVAPWRPRWAAIGSGMAVFCFLITLSFMFSTPGVVQAGFSGPLALSPMPGQFLLKDLVLLCVSFWTLGLALEDDRRMR